MKIAVLLKIDTLDELTFSAAHAERLVEQIPACTLAVCDHEDDFVNELADADVALVWTFKQEWFALAPKLRVVSTPSAGRDYFQVTPPENVCMMYGSFQGKIMGETAVGMILGLSHGLIPNARIMADPTVVWPHDVFTGKARRLMGAHVVILGFGHIGHEAGKMLKHFGARLTGIRRNPAGDSPLWFDDGDKVVSTEELDRVLPFADHLLCILPRDEETTGILNAERLALLPPTAYLYNIGRGHAIDEKALVSALRKGKLAGAVLDVFNHEPLPADSPLRSTPNAFLYPHVSAVSPDYLDLYLDELIPRLQHACHA